MTIIQAVLLALTQGIAEFLPISSSGHLSLLQYLLRLQPSLSLDIILNTASLLSVLVYFSRQSKYFFTNFKYILVGSIPAGLVGVLFKNQIEQIFNNFHLLPFFFLITAGLLISTKFKHTSDAKMNYKKALIIGAMQAVAILPAVSRSGATITTALLLGFTATEAFNLSFSLFIPASIGALLLDSRHIGQVISSPQLPLISLAFIVTFLVGLVSLDFLKKMVTRSQLWYFGIYCLFVALISFLVIR